MQGKAIASSADGDVIEVEATMASMQGPEGDLSESIWSVKVSVNIPVNENNEFTHPETGKIYIINSNRL